MIPNWDPDIYFLVIAHPDDESMFFFPTIKNLLSSKQQQTQFNTYASSPTEPVNTNLHIVCLSNGDYDHLGHIREKELYNAANGVLGVPMENIHLVNNPQEMPDHPTLEWDKNIVADSLETCVEKECHYFLDANSDKEDSATNELISVSSSLAEQCQHKNVKIAVLTFDSGGVSGHANHVDTWKGVTHFIKRNQQKIHQDLCQVPPNNRNTSPHGKNYHMDIRGYELHTIYFSIQKYFPPLDWIIQCLYFSMLRLWTTCYPFGRNNPDAFKSISFYSFSFQPLQVWRAMAAHTSQFVWYRKLSVLWSRYTYINTWTEMESDAWMIDTPTTTCNFDKIKHC